MPMITFHGASTEAKYYVILSLGQRALFAHMYSYHHRLLLIHVLIFFWRRKVPGRTGARNIMSGLGHMVDLYYLFWRHLVVVHRIN
jgi:hypothetical protein